MSIVIERVDTATPALQAFVAAHHAEMEGTAPPESQHAVSFDRLLEPGVRLFAGYHEGRPVATGALAAVDDSHEELKSMRIAPTSRRQGFGRAMLAFLIGDAGSRGIRRLSLETGRDPFFAPARALYADAGFVECEAFGRYLPDPHSAFLTLAPVPVAGMEAAPHAG